jgi:hypothetical protein
MKDIYLADWPTPSKKKMYSDSGLGQTGEVSNDITKPRKQSE